MKRSLALKIALCLVALTMGVPAFALVPAADKPSTDPVEGMVSLDLKDVDATAAIDALFRGKKLNFSVSRDVGGVIPSLSIRDVPMRQALTSLLKCIGAVQRTENGVVMIEMPKPWSTNVSVNFKDVPLREAVDALANKAGAPSVQIARDVPNPKITYSATDESYIRVLRAVAKLAGTKFDGGSISAGDPWQKQIAIEFRDVPLADAVEGMLKDTGISYTVDPGIQQLKVTAVLKNISLEQGFNQVIKAAGAVYRVENGVYSIGPRPTTFENTSGSAALAAPPGTPAGGTETIVVTVEYVDASDVAALLSGRGVTISATNRNKLILTGTVNDLEKVTAIINALDDETAFPRIVRLKMDVKTTVHTAKGQKTYDTSTESVGPDRGIILLNLSAVMPYMTSYTTVTKTGQAVKQSQPNFVSAPTIYVNLMPTITADGSICLTGKGSISIAFGSPIPTQIAKDFDVAASATPGQPVVVAAGSATTDQGKAEFKVTVTATMEKGRARAIGLLPSASPASFGDNNRGYGGNGMSTNNRGYGGTTGYGQSYGGVYGGYRGMNSGYGSGSGSSSGGSSASPVRPPQPPPAPATDQKKEPAKPADSKK